METQSQSAKPMASVRWPFRILAALIVLAGVLAIIGGIVAGWSRRAPWSKWQLLANLPGVLSLVRLAWFAAINGRSPANPSWPFASDRILFIYMAVLMVLYLE